MKKQITDTALLVVGILIASYIWYKWQQKLDAKAISNSQAAAEPQQ